MTHSQDSRNLDEALRDEEEFVYLLSMFGDGYVDLDLVNEVAEEKKSEQVVDNLS